MGMTQVEYAEHRGCKKQYINRLVREGKIPVDANKKINPVTADAALANLADPSRAAVIKSNAERYGKQSPLIHPDEQEVMSNLPQFPKAEPPSPPPQPESAMPPGSYAEAKRDRERSLADRAKWDLDVEKGVYVSRDIASQLAFQAGRSWRDQLTEVQSTLPTAIISLIKQHLPTAPGDAVLKIQHAITEQVLTAHRAALKNVAQQITDLSASLDAAPN